MVHAQATVRGGHAPYQFSWGSARSALEPEVANGGDEIRYTPTSPSGATAGDERVHVTVTDQDGLFVHIPKNIFTALLPEGDIEPTDNPTIAYEYITGGLKNTWDNASGFWNTMNDPGIDKKFAKSAFEARERDFKDPTLGGVDSAWVDAVDMLYYAGHASGRHGDQQHAQPHGNASPPMSRFAPHVPAPFGVLRLETHEALRGKMSRAGGARNSDGAVLRT